MAGHGSINSIRGQTKDQKESPPEKKVEESDDNRNDPLMPHLIFNDQELEKRYPRLTAPEDEHADDPAIDAADLTLQVGQRIAEEIRGTMRAEGRRRRKMTSSVVGVCGGATDGRPSTYALLDEFCEGATVGRPLTLIDFKSKPLRCANGLQARAQEGWQERLVFTYSLS